jgi:hypothetical protein
MVTVLIDGIPADWECADIHELLHPFCPSHVSMAADHSGKLLGFGFVFFRDERSAAQAIMAVGRGTASQTAFLQYVLPEKAAYANGLMSLACLPRL